MNTKKLIMVCLVATALIAAMELSELLPDMVAAFLLIGGGCAVAYFMALNEQIRRTINELNFILKTEQILNSSPSPSIVLERLKDYVQNETEGQVYFSSQVPWINKDDVEVYEKLFTVIDPLVMEGRKTLIWPDAEGKEGASWWEQYELTELMAVPVQHRQELLGVLYILGDSPLHLARRQYMAERLALCAANAIKQHRLYEEEHDHDLVIIKSIVNSIDMQQPFFAGHSERVAFASTLTASRLNLTPEELTALKYGALLHDAGKMMTADGQENAWGMDHPARGAAILPEDEFFLPVKEAILSHHERYDGKGYPQGLSRNDIPFLARIIAVADVYDALIRLCPEEERLSHVQAVQTIRKATGTLFDPLVVVAFEEVEEEINAYYIKD